MAGIYSYLPFQALVEAHLLSESLRNCYDARLSASIFMKRVTLTPGEALHDIGLMNLWTYRSIDLAGYLHDPTMYGHVLRKIEGLWTQSVSLLTISMRV